MVPADTRPPDDGAEVPDLLSDEPLVLPTVDPDLVPLWQTALTTLRWGLPAADYHEVLRYVQLREIDREQGWALLSAPNAALCAQVQTRLREPIQAALRLAAHTALQVLTVVPTPHYTATLAQLLADQAAPPAEPGRPSPAAVAPIPNDPRAAEAVIERRSP